MTISVTHTKVSTIPDGADTDLIRPSDWNSEHTISGVAASGANSDITSLSGITGAISTPDYIAFDTAYATTLAAGQLGWDGNNTLGLGMIGGNVIQHIGEDQFFYCKASSAITKGQVVMFTGAVGASGVPTGAPATGITDGTYIMGVAAESIALNGFGLVQSFGTLRNVNTSGYADGDILWYNPAVTGGLTKTKPSAPNIKVQMAAVINGGSSGGGTILIRIDPGSTLGGTDSNAQITSPTAAQIITYASADGYWKNTSLTAGTGISINNATTGVVTVTNSAPDQTVAISAGTGISVTGTYPNFTVTNTSPSSGGTVTSVTGTAPIASSGGNTPAISISQATTSTDGYLSSTDWNTFNNKQPAGSYLTAVTADSPLSGSGTSGSHLVIAQATTSTNGYLSSTDWNTFNNKATYPSQTGNNGKFLKTDGSAVSWASLPTYMPVLTNAGTTTNVSVANGYLAVLTNGGSTVNVTVS